MSQSVEVVVEGEVQFGEVEGDEISGEPPAGVAEGGSGVKEGRKGGLQTPSPFAAGPPSSEGSTEGWGWKTASLSDGKIPSISDSEMCEDSTGEDWLRVLYVVWSWGFA